METESSTSFHRAWSIVKKEGEEAKLEDLNAYMNVFISQTDIKLKWREKVWGIITKKKICRPTCKVENGILTVDLCNFVKILTRIDLKKPYRFEYNIDIEINKEEQEFLQEYKRRISDICSFIIQEIQNFLDGEEG